jgi:hypothetical protein
MNAIQLEGGSGIVIKWASFIFIGFFKILVVLYVFGQLRGRPETVIVPILGLIYCSLSSGFIYRSFQDLNLILVLNDLYTQVKTIGDPNYSWSHGEYEALEKKVQFGKRLWYLNAVVDGIIGVICLLELFSAL